MFLLVCGDRRKHAVWKTKCPREHLCSLETSWRSQCPPARCPGQETENGIELAPRVEAGPELSHQPQGPGGGGGGGGQQQGSGGAPCAEAKSNYRLWQPARPSESSHSLQKLRLVCAKGLHRWPLVSHLMDQNEVPTPRPEADGPQHLTIVQIFIFRVAFRVSC